MLQNYLRETSDMYHDNRSKPGCFPPKHDILAAPTTAVESVHCGRARIVSKDLHQHYQHMDHKIDENTRIIPDRIMPPKSFVRFYVDHR